MSNRMKNIIFQLEGCINKIWNRMYLFFLMVVSSFQCREGRIVTWNGLDDSGTVCHPQSDTATANNFAITFAQANRVGRPRRVNGRVRTKIRKGKGNPYNNSKRPTKKTSGYLVSVKDGPLFVDSSTYLT